MHKVLGGGPGKCAPDNVRLMHPTPGEVRRSSVLNVTLILTATEKR